MKAKINPKFQMPIYELEDLQQRGSTGEVIRQNKTYSWVQFNLLSELSIFRIRNNRLIFIQGEN